MSRPRCEGNSVPDGILRPRHCYRHRQSRWTGRPPGRQQRAGAHVPNINDFVEGMKIVLADDGVITMEFRISNV